MLKIKIILKMSFQLPTYLFTFCMFVHVHSRKDPFTLPFPSHEKNPSFTESGPEVSWKHLFPGLLNIYM